MSRTTYVWRDGKCIEKSKAPPKKGGVFVISDDLGQQLEHHGYSDGRRTDSKSTFRRWTQEAGLVEKGNDRERAPRRQGEELKQVIRDVAEATQMVKAGYVPQLRRVNGFDGDF